MTKYKYFVGESQEELKLQGPKAFELCRSGHTTTAVNVIGQDNECHACHGQLCTDQSAVSWLMDQCGGELEYQTQRGGWLNHIPSLWWGGRQRYAAEDEVEQGNKWIKRERSHCWKTWQSAVSHSLVSDPSWGGKKERRELFFLNCCFWFRFSPL